MFRIDVFVLSMALVLALLSGRVLAQSRQGLIIDGTIVASFDDNVFRSNVEESDRVIQFTPTISLNGLYGKHNFAFEYVGDFAQYSENSDFNYFQHNFNGFALLDINRTINAQFNLFYQDKIEKPGVNSSLLDDDAEEFNEYTITGLNAALFYGTKRSLGQLVLIFDVNNRDYSNNSQEFRDVDSSAITARFFYNLGDKTRLLLEAGTGDYDYIQNETTIDRSNSELELLAGVTWEATAKTSGVFRVGYKNKEYNSDQFKTISGLSYFFNVEWQPTSYTSFSLGSTKNPNESAQINEGGLFRTTYSIEAQHEITSRTNFLTEYKFYKDEVALFEGNRTDEREEFSVGVGFIINRWLDSKVGYRYLNRTSELDTFNYTANIFEISLSSSFD
ncbi:outer membrane beta-barrel protein [uncultured Paraglaciecola sp.]|uniref:outer membrane beta-barrel protein n=1 Tax=uncultured Paraglaciecola sp. TaxID=1765024 RepID=UPI0025955835|nr:outer membrane beta-barrel protein [uncultured Paraglaciecola sp.]